MTLRRRHLLLLGWLGWPLIALDLHRRRRRGGYAL